MTGKELLDLQERRFSKQLKGARSYIDKQGDSYAETHDWFYQFISGEGVDLAAGNFPTEAGMLCVDSVQRLGNLLNGFEADVTNLHHIDSSSLDFVLCNYLEGVEKTITALNEWYRILKHEGYLAIIVSNAESERYQIEKGPLKNRRRLVLFTPLTIQRYLERAGFTQILVENYKHQLRVSAQKP